MSQTVTTTIASGQNSDDEAQALAFFYDFISIKNFCKKPLLPLCPPDCIPISPAELIERRHRYLFMKTSLLRTRDALGLSEDVHSSKHTKVFHSQQAKPPSKLLAISAVNASPVTSCNSEDFKFGDSTEPGSIEILLFAKSIDYSKFISFGSESHVVERESSRMLKPDFQLLSTYLKDEFKLSQVGDRFGYVSGPVAIWIQSCSELTGGRIKITFMKEQIEVACFVHIEAHPRVLIIKYITVLSFSVLGPKLVTQGAGYLNEDGHFLIIRPGLMSVGAVLRKELTVKQTGHELGMSLYDALPLRSGLNSLPLEDRLTTYGPDLSSEPLDDVSVKISTLLKHYGLSEHQRFLLLKAADATLGAFITTSTGDTMKVTSEDGPHCIERVLFRWLLAKSFIPKYSAQRIGSHVVRSLPGDSLELRKILYCLPSPRTVDGVSYVAICTIALSVLPAFSGRINRTPMWETILSEQRIPLLSLDLAPRTLGMLPLQLSKHFNKKSMFNYRGEWYNISPMLQAIRDQYPGKVVAARLPFCTVVSGKDRFYVTAQPSYSTIVGPHVRFAGTKGFFSSALTPGTAWLEFAALLSDLPNAK